MNSLLTREKSSDRLVRGIDVFDSFGQIIYSTDRLRVGEKVPKEWTEISERAKSTEWGLEGTNEYVAGISLKKEGPSLFLLMMMWTRS